MIRVHRLNGQEVLVNAELIEIIEAHGQETVIRLSTGNHFVVKELVDSVVERVMEYRKTVGGKIPSPLTGEGERTQRRA